MPTLLMAGTFSKLVASTNTIATSVQAGTSASTGVDPETSILGSFRLRSTAGVHTNTPNPVGLTGAEV